MKSVVFGKMKSEEDKKKLRTRCEIQGGESREIYTFMEVLGSARLGTQITCLSIWHSGQRTRNYFKSGKRGHFRGECPRNVRRKTEGSVGGFVDCSVITVVPVRQLKIKRKR